MVWLGEWVSQPARLPLSSGEVNLRHILSPIPGGPGHPG